MKGGGKWPVNLQLGPMWLARAHTCPTLARAHTCSHPPTLRSSAATLTGDRSCAERAGSASYTTYIHTCPHPPTLRSSAATLTGDRSSADPAGGTSGTSRRDRSWAVPRATLASNGPCT